MCEGTAFIFDEWARESSKVHYRDRRSLLSPEEMVKWQLTRQELRGKLISLEEDTVGYPFNGLINDLGNLDTEPLRLSGFGLILSLVPVQRICWHTRFDGYAFLVLMNEKVWLVEK